MRLKPSGLRYLDISRNFNEVSGFVMLFCAVFIYQYFCAVLLCYVANTPPSLCIGLLFDLKFYYMHVKVSCEGIDTGADLRVLTHRQC